MWRNVGFAALTALFALCASVAYRALTFGADVASAETAKLGEAGLFDEAALAAHLGEAIRFRTVSLTGADADDPAAFAALHAWMETTYPAFHRLAQREFVAERSLVYTWPGKNPALAPILFLAHQDVVPVPADTRSAWTREPFGGEVADGYIWGRGALDDKASLVALLEAAEHMAAQGQTPERTLIFAFGHDEELGGEGAKAMAALLNERSVRAWFALDEGMAALREHPLTGKPAALVGVAEKGFGTMRVSAAGAPGHSSMPPADTAVSRLARAVSAIHAMPISHAIAGGPAEEMMVALAADLSPLNRTVLANEWLLGPLLRARLTDDRAAQALLGTTVAPTVIAGGDRANVLPGEAHALINFRIHPRDTPETLLARARAAVASIEGVSVDWDEPPNAASPVSSASASSYRAIAAASRAILPEARLAPGLVLGATDARHYAGVAENVYRYQAVLLGPEDWESIHGLNERIAPDNLVRLTRFYGALMQMGEE